MPRRAYLRKKHANSFETQYIGRSDLGLQRNYCAEHYTNVLIHVADLSDERQNNVVHNAWYGVVVKSRASRTERLFDPDSNLSLQLVA